MRSGLLVLVAAASIEVACQRPDPCPYPDPWAMRSYTPSYPYRDEWRVELETDFPPDDEHELTAITVGGAADAEQFPKTGDIIVELGEPDGQIKIEMRRFLFGQCESQRFYEEAELWARAGTTPLEWLSDNTSGHDCTNGPWRHGCQIMVHVDDDSHPDVDGADIRVTLPSDRRYDLRVVAGDSVAVEGYPDRGDVCISGLNGNADVELESGLAFVVLDEHVTPAPGCVLGEVEACEDVGWGDGCSCDEFGSVRVGTTGESAADAVVDVPLSLWASMAVQNLDESQHIDGTYCTASIHHSNAEVQTLPQTPWIADGVANQPDNSPATGYQIVVESSRCKEIPFAENLLDFIDNYQPPDSEIRGNLKVCSGCLRTNTCAGLLLGE